MLVCWGLAACWFAVTFAQAAQVSRRLPWRLRKLRWVSRRLPWGLPYPCRPGFRPGLWSTGPTARPGTGERPVGALDHSQGRNPWAGRAFYVLIGISVRLHLAFASGFLSVCEGKGLYVRRACQYVILRISSRPCTWPECSFYRRPIYCLSAPYAFRGVPEIHEP